MLESVSKQTSTQLLHLVFGGELDDLTDIEFQNLADWPHEGD